MTKIPSLLILGAAVFLPPTSGAQGADAARDRLARAARAVGSLRAASFRVEACGLGLEPAVTPVRAQVKLAALEDRGAVGARLRVVGQRLAESGDWGERFLAIYDGQQAHWVGPGAGEPVQGGDELLGEVLSLVPAELRSASPFAEQLAAQDLRVEGRAVVADIPCHVIWVDLGGDRSERWHLALTDGLPRRVERMQGPPPGRREVLVLSGFDPDPRLSEADFAAPPAQAGGPRRTGGSGPDASLLAVGSEAPPWELRDGAGNVVRLADLRGEVVLLDFWATWCAPCKQAMPGLQGLHEEFGERGLRVLGVSCMERDPSKAVDYMRKKGFTYGLLLGGDAVALEYGVQGLPVLYLIGKEGRVLYRRVGFDPTGRSEREMARLIAEDLGGEG